MPDGVTEGMATLKEILSIAPQTKVIVVTGNHDRDNAVRAVSLGAYDFYQKPVDTDVLRLLVGRAFHIHSLEEQNRLLRETQTRLAVRRASSPPTIPCSRCAASSRRWRRPTCRC